METENREGVLKSMVLSGAEKRGFIDHLETSKELRSLREGGARNCVLVPKKIVTSK